MGSTALADYDNDGDLDLFITGKGIATNRFLVYENNAGAFALSAEPMGFNWGIYNSSIACGDLDDDGVFETSGEIIRKSWSDDGIYFVTLRVTDGRGLYNEKRTTVIVGGIHDVPDLLGRAK